MNLSEKDLTPEVGGGYESPLSAYSLEPAESLQASIVLPEVKF